MSKKRRAAIEIDIADRLSLSAEGGEVASTVTPTGEVITYVTRQGYRKVAARQPDYIRHVVYPIYPDTKIVTDGHNIEVTMGGDMSNITGAIGILYKKDMPGYIMSYTSMSDYEHKVAEKGDYWDRMQHTMLMKVCETSLIRAAYPELFGSIYFEEESPDKDVTDRGAIVKYIRRNMQVAKEYILTDRPLESLHIDALRDIEKKTKESVNERKTKDKKHKGTK